jgi:hypothetical protein
MDVLDRSVRRARWLAELASALDRAGELAQILATRAKPSEDMIELRETIGALQVEVNSLRRGGLTPRQLHPEWMQWR